MGLEKFSVFREELGIRLTEDEKSLLDDMQNECMKRSIDFNGFLEKIMSIRKR